MNELGLIEGATAPLFDRLRMAKSSAEMQPLRALNRQEVQASVCRELAYLFNTRSPLSTARFATTALTVLDYGLPDFSALSPRNSTDRECMSLLVVRALTAFEPRLQQVRATVELLAGNPQALLVNLQALLQVELLVEPIALAVVLPHKVDAGQGVEVRPLLPLVAR